MIKLIDLLKEAAEESLPQSDKEGLSQLEDLVQSLQEGGALEEGLQDTLKQIKDILSKSAKPALLGAALLASTTFASAQPNVQKQIKSAVQQATKQTPQETEVYAGNKEMNKIKVSNQALADYKSEPQNSDFWVGGSDDIKKVQEAIKVYRAWTLEEWKQGKGMIGSEKFYKDLSDEERREVEQNYMKSISKTDKDGINGEYTSKSRFPQAFLKDLNTDKVVNLGVEGNYKLNDLVKTITIDQMKEWNNFVEWMKTHGPQKQ